MSDKERIIRHLLLLITVLLIAFSLIVTALYKDESKLDKRDARIYDYHLTLSERSLNVLNLINKTKLWLLEYEAKYGGVVNNESPIKIALSVRDKIESFQYLTNKSINDISLLQNKYSVPEFEVITSLLLKSHSNFEYRLKEIIATDNIGYASIDAVTKPLFSRVHQFRLLHKNAYKRDRSLAVALSHESKIRIFALIFTIIAIASIGTIITFKHVLNILRKLDIANIRLLQKSRVIDQINDSVIVTNLNGVITSWNKAATDLFRYDYDEMIGKNIKLIFTNEDQYKLTNEIIPALNNYGDYRVEIPLRQKSGKLISSQLSMSIIHDDNNINIGMVCYCTDITERKNYEKQITKLASVVENSPEFIGIATIDGEPLFLNKAGKKLAGIENDEQLFNYSILDFFAPEDRSVVVEQIIPTVMAKGEWAGEVFFRHFISKELIPVGVNIFRIDDPTSGNPINLATVTRDLTEVKKIQAELSASEFRFRSVLESTPSGIFQTDAHGKCVYINESYQNIAGIELEDALGDGWTNAVHPDDKEDVFAEWDNAVKENRMFYMEYRMLTSSNDVIWVLGQANNEIDSQGEVVSYIGTITDITENKLLTSELRSYQDILEERVEERTRTMQKALASAEHASKAKSDFVSHMSHELRTPLNAILGFAQMLKLDKDDFNDEQNENVGEIFDAGHHLLVLINDVLDLARIESGNFSVSLEEVSVNTVIDESVIFIMHDVDARCITLFNNTDKEEYFVYADSIKLKQVILNLLSNAVKYNRDNGRITIDLHTVEDDMLRISVADTGYGISAEDLPHVFDNFERLNQTNDVEGTGIGLVISKNIMELMDGKIGVKSEASFGTVFWVDIPLYDQSII